MDGRTNTKAISPNNLKNAVGMMQAMNTDFEDKRSDSGPETPGCVEGALSLDAVARFWPFDLEQAKEVSDRFPFRMNRYVLELIRSAGDPIGRQVVPDISELEDRTGFEDPLAEEDLSPVPNLVHRYPNRVLWLVSHECAAHCRFCTRKRRWQSPIPMTEDGLRAGLDYIARHSEVKDILLSGGDPLLLPLSRLETIMSSLRRIPHVEIIRIGTRVPCFLPQKVTPGMVELLSRHHPVFMNIHFNHPLEITSESRRACAMLANAGIVLGSQTVLLRGINDNTETLGELFQKLLTLRVRPYYLMQMDLTRGTAHFRTPVSTGLSILSALRNRISGLAVPHFVLDLPGGQGKVPLTPNYIDAIEGDWLVIRDYKGNQCHYPLLAGEGAELGRWLGR